MGSGPGTASIGWGWPVGVETCSSVTQAGKLWPPDQIEMIDPRVKSDFILSKGCKNKKE